MGRRHHTRDRTTLVTAMHAVNFDLLCWGGFDGGGSRAGLIPAWIVLSGSVFSASMLLMRIQVVCAESDKAGINPARLSS